MPNARACCSPRAACSIYVQDASKSLSRRLDKSDQVLVSDYLESVREVEKRVPEAEREGRLVRQSAERTAGRAG